MNNIYKIAFVGIVGLTSFSINVFGQVAKKDTLLNREVYLEREYTPTIEDASKVSISPAIHKVQKKQYDVKFEQTTPRINFSSYGVGDTGSGDIQTAMNYSKYRGYLNLGVGFYTNLEGALGYRIVDSAKDRLDIFGTHTSTNARVKYLNQDYPLKEVKAKDMENFIKLKYAHDFDALTWTLGGSFLGDSYNYYGNPYVVSLSPAYSIESLEKKQSFSIFEVATSIKSKEKEGYEYDGSIQYNRFSLKYGPSILYDGVTANFVDAKANVNFPLLNSLKFGVKGEFFYQGSDDVPYYTGVGVNPFHDLTVVKANPYFKVVGDNFHILLGASFNQAFDAFDKTVLAPTANLWWNFQERSAFYLNLDGGINKNSLVDIYKENKYVDPSRKVDPSKTPYDLVVGVKSGVIDAFEFDVFGGYKYTKDAHLYVQGSSLSWNNVSEVLYGNLGTGHFGLEVKTKLIPYTDLSLKGVGYFYNLKDYSNGSMALIEKKPWGLPSFTLGLNADFTFMDNLVLTASYQLESGRKTYSFMKPVDMKAINEFNVRANYELLDWLSIYAKANNLFNQKYERYYGYTLQGISLLGGVSLKF